MKQFISVHDVINPSFGGVGEAIDSLVQKALAYKANPFIDKHLGAGKRMGLIFLNPSLRTRLSTQIAAENLGMQPIIFNVGNEGWTWEFEEEAIMSGTSVEHVKDAAPILGNYFDILAIRTFPGLKVKEDDYSETYIKQFIKYAGVPVVSLESATLHPLQSLTDILTIQESLMLNAKSLTQKAESETLSAEDKTQPSALSIRPKIVLTWAPHIKPLPQCVANSFSQWMTAWDKADFVIAHPEEYELDEQFTKGATITHNQDEALKNADFVYVKNWSTFTDYGRIYCNDPDWMLTEEKLKHTNNARIMHCLPVRRNVELSDEVLDSQHSIITQQASNRVWAAQAVLSEILKGNG